MKKDTVVLLIFLIGLSFAVFAVPLSRLSMRAYIFITNADPMTQNLFHLSEIHIRTFMALSLLFFVAAIVIRFLPGRD